MCTLYIRECGSTLYVEFQGQFAMMSLCNHNGDTIQRNRVRIEKMLCLLDEESVPGACRFGWK